MRFNYSFLFWTRNLFWTILLVFSPLVSHASGLIYTIQAASYMNETDALRYYSEIEQKLRTDELDYLRVEKVGTFYSVRLGKYDDLNSIKKFLLSIESHLPSAIVMKAYMKGERLVKMYSHKGAPEEQITRGKTIPKPDAVKAKPKINKAAASAHKAKGDRYWETDRHF